MIRTGSTVVLILFCSKVPVAALISYDNLHIYVKKFRNESILQYP